MTPKQHQVNEEANAHVAEFVRGKISEVVEDPAVAKKVKPRGYPITSPAAPPLGQGPH